MRLILSVLSNTSIEKRLDEMMEEAVVLNHNKQEYPPMHTAEHILNQTMVRMFGCKRSVNAHIERKKSKCDYVLAEAPTDEQMAEVERRVNEVIAQQLPVSVGFVTVEEASIVADLSKLPDESGDVVRLVRVGDYDTCACAGTHVSNTAEIGLFRIISWDYAEGRLRIRFKLED
jgi:alanyl-tRNA synthetase